MKIILAPDKFKNSSTGLEFCDAVEEGICKITSDLEITPLPLADGGDGTIDLKENSIENLGIKYTNTVMSYANNFKDAMQNSFDYLKK
jgi:glycerate kinase